MLDARSHPHNATMRNVVPMYATNQQVWKCVRGTHADGTTRFYSCAGRNQQVWKCVRGTHAAVDIPDFAEDFDKLDGLEIVVKDIFTAGDAAVDVIDRSRKKQAGASRHEISPMRGRDNPILLSPSQKSTSVEVCTWHPCAMVNVAPM